MKNIVFGPLTFALTDEGILTLSSLYAFSDQNQSLCEVDLAGGITSGSNKISGSARTKELRYVRHSIDGRTITLVQQNTEMEVTSRFTLYEDTNAVRVTQSIQNITDAEICLELANTVGLHFGKSTMGEAKDWFFHRFHNARYTEGMPEIRSLYDNGLVWNNCLFTVENVGNHSSYRYLPQGILENRRDGGFLQFQIETYQGWIYEISCAANGFQLQIGGPTALHHAWNRILAPGESYTTVPVALAYGDTLNGVLGQMTLYRRHLRPDHPADRELPAIYNEYMHFSWDSPFAERIYQNAPVAASAGCEYYVIDCGWHNGFECDRIPLGVYPYFGTWFENRERFPDGIRAAADYVHSLGMKFGMWIAPEVVGKKNTEMLDYYGDECFFTRNGRKISSFSGHLLDFRQPKVRAYMSETFRRMIEDYGCDYIKYDGSPNPGFGTDRDAASPGSGLECAVDAFLDWTREMMQTYPQVIFEDCAGGGQRIDYEALSLFQLVSTSDQTDYTRYPYISTNLLASVLPEQAAVWSYPVDSKWYDRDHEDAVNAKISREVVVMNMINSLLGRVHLASRIHLLDEEKFALIREGMDVYHRMTPDKRRALPYLPLGYAAFGDTLAAAGLKTAEKVYLAVWNLHGDRHVRIPLPEITASSAKVLYPTTLPTTFALDGDGLVIDFTEDEQARLFAIEY